MDPEKTKRNHARNQEKRQQDTKRQYRLGDHGTENVTRGSLLFYRVLEKQRVVRVVRMFHGAMNVDALL